MDLCNVILIDGTRVRSDSEPWRAECEARAVLHMPSKMRRNMYIFHVEKKRGADSAKKLRDDVWRVWEQSQRGMAAEFEATEEAKHRSIQ